MTAPARTKQHEKNPVVVTSMPDVDIPHLALGSHWNRIFGITDYGALGLSQAADAVADATISIGSRSAIQSPASYPVVTVKAAPWFELAQRTEALPWRGHDAQESGSISIQTSINVIHSADIELLKPIPVSLYGTDDEIQGSAFDLNCHVTADSLQLCFDALSEEIESLFLRLSKLEPEKLGPLPSRQLASMKSFLKAKS